eukprot:CAMPEP_0170579036 /NCGR_PEP_ID=MMETSP0224-20130122/5773_1 /TAXON_ID=285029 /ORGANISM="Togula jolla, Strain CCCM 725" /LENGTH=91 /DNA_ID=CAMNT_0010902041 /DNA_START=389 /DNA_END=665 /DNA_ORIENTATION=+
MTDVPTSATEAAAGTPRPASGAPLEGRAAGQPQQQVEVLAMRHSLASAWRPQVPLQMAMAQRSLRRWRSHQKAEGPGEPPAGPADCERWTC